MLPGDILPSLCAPAWTAGEVVDFNSANLKGVYAAIVFYEGDFNLVSLSELQGLAGALKETDCRLVAVSTSQII
jgi:alkyl hydroperoxide reductase subunit AhpC